MDTNEKAGSKFLKVKCLECEGEQIMFDRASMEVKCNMCGSTLATPTGGQSKILGTVIEIVDRR